MGTNLLQCNAMQFNTNKTRQCIAVHYLDLDRDLCLLTLNFIVNL